MEKTVTFYINRTTPAKLEEELVICKPLKRLTISVDVEKEATSLLEMKKTEYGFRRCLDTGSGRS